MVSSPLMLMGQSDSSGDQSPYIPSSGENFNFNLYLESKFDSQREISVDGGPPWYLGINDWVPDRLENWWYN